MRVLVTGGAGFVGSHLVRALLARGDHVVVLDDLSTGRRANLPIGMAGRLEFHHGSAADAARVRYLVTEADLVFHLAATVGVSLVVEQPHAALRNNVGTARVVLEAAARSGCRVVLASSSEVYAPTAPLPFREERTGGPAPLVHPRAVYSRSKLAGERLARELFERQGLPVVACRLFNVVGARQSGRYGMVLPRFVRQALAGSPVTVYGDGRQTRCFAYVEDVVDCLLALAACAAATGAVVNVGSDREVSILDLSRAVLRVVGGSSPIVHRRRRLAEPRRRVPGLQRLRALTGLECRTPLESMIGAVVRDRQHRDASVHAAESVTVDG